MLSNAEGSRGCCVRYEQQGTVVQAIVCQEVNQQIDYLSGRVGIEIGGGFVQQHYIGFEGERANERETLLLTAGETLDRPAQYIIR